MRIEFILDEILKEEIEPIVDLYRPMPGGSDGSRNGRSPVYVVVLFIFYLALYLVLPGHWSNFLRALVSVITLIVFGLIFFLFPRRKSITDTQFNFACGLLTDEGIEFHGGNEEKLWLWHSIYAWKYVEGAIMVQFTPRLSQIFLSRFFGSKHDWYDFVKEVQNRIERGWMVREVDG